jgi:DNA-binding NtrC family response regulator
MSGYAHAVLTAQGTLQPGATLLEKPFSEDVMLAKVREALGAGSGPRDQTTPVPAAPRRTRVLIVDDQPMIAMTFRRLLERASMEVVGVAATVERGVDLLAEHEPDVVVLDNLLPDGLGLDAVGRMLALAPTTRVVMASGEESDTARDAAIRAGCAGFVDKSAAVARLVPAIREALAPGADVAQGVTRGDLQAGGTH